MALPHHNAAAHLAPGGIVTSHVLDYGLLASRTVESIGDATGTPFLKTIAAVSTTIMQFLQNVKYNREECMRLTERAYELICAIINACGDYQGNIPPAMLHNIGKFTETLQKILSFVRIQAGHGRLKRLLRSMEITALLTECNKGLQHAMDVFGVQCSVITTMALAEIQATASQRHDEILDILRGKPSKPESTNAKPPGSTTGRRTTLPSLPASPQIFNGREAELQLLLSTLAVHETPARIAVLGQCGIGKTSLALAAAHHPESASCFQDRRFFVPCEATTSADELAHTIAASLGLEGAAKPSEAIINRLQALSGPSLFILDNFESPWEAPEKRLKTEEFLALLCDVKCLNIIITIRGAERPSNVRWTRPFLPPLKPLSTESALQTFMDIADVTPEEPDLPEVLNLTDNLPLAVNLMANLASCEGCTSLLARWNNESTSLLSEGADKSSSLDYSIAISLTSPRLNSTPDARELLSLLSLLPDGISEGALLQLELPLRDILKCKSALCRTALAYIDDSGRLKALTPIRAYMLRVHPPAQSNFLLLKKHICELVDLIYEFQRTPSSDLFRKMSSNVGNVHSVMRYALHEIPERSVDTIRCIVKLANIPSNSRFRLVDLLLSIEDQVNDTADEQLRGMYHFALADVPDSKLSPLEHYSEALRSYEVAGDVNNQCLALIELAAAYLSETGDKSTALYSCNSALVLAKEAGDLDLQSKVLATISSIVGFYGNVDDALVHLDEAQALAKLTGNLLSEAQLISAQVELYMIAGDLQRCSELIDEASLILCAIGLDPVHSPDFSMLTENRAMVHFLRTEYTEAKDVYQLLASEDNSVSRELLERRGEALTMLANIEMRIGGASHPDVQRNLDTAEQLFTHVDSSIQLLEIKIDHARVLFSIGQYNAAQNQCRACLRVLPEHQYFAKLRCIELLGEISEAKGDSVLALHLYVECISLARQRSFRPTLFDSLKHIGDVFLAQGDEETALALFEVALYGFKWMGIHQRKGECMVRIGDILHNRGNSQRARVLWEKARPLFERTLQQNDLVSCVHRLQS